MLCFIISSYMLKYLRLFSMSLLNMLYDVILVATQYFCCHSPCLFLLIFFFMACTVSCHFMTYFIVSCLPLQLKQKLQQDRALGGLSLLCPQNTESSVMHAQHSAPVCGAGEWL